MLVLTTLENLKQNWKFGSKLKSGARDKTKNNIKNN